MEKCRYIALTDVNPGKLPWTEKDDIQSLMRLLLYANEVDIEGIVLCSSCFLKRGGGRGAEKIVQNMLDAYAAAKPNLDRHASGYPEADALRARVNIGIPAFGQAPGRGFAEKRYNNNPGVQCIIRAVDAPDPRPVWVGLWGGANTLAQAIWQVSCTRSDAELKHFLHKLRILSISDQDNSAAWIRENWGSDLFYRVDPSQGTKQGTKTYCRAVWPGISGDHFQHGSEDGVHGGGFTGADEEVFGEQWLDKHIRAVGLLGACYPKTVYMAEGDTPAYLSLLPNGLNRPEQPELGGWAGRYAQTIGPEKPLYGAAWPIRLRERMISSIQAHRLGYGAGAPTSKTNLRRGCNGPYSRIMRAAPIRRRFVFREKRLMADIRVGALCWMLHHRAARTASRSHSGGSGIRSFAAKQPCRR